MRAIDSIEMANSDFSSPTVARIHLFKIDLWNARPANEATSFHLKKFHLNIVTVLLMEIDGDNGKIDDDRFQGS